MKPLLFIFGFGYTAQALTEELSKHNFLIVGTSRAARTEVNEEPALSLINYDQSVVSAHLERATHLLISIPPQRHEGDWVLAHYPELIKKQAPKLKWLGYLSSTGVYGDHQGNWVDEDSACTPHTATGIARLEAERAWMSLAQHYQWPLHIFRLAGIYGPRRNSLERLKQGKAYSLFKEGQFFSRIHVADIVTTLVASMHQPKPLSIYNVTDDLPSPSHRVDEFAATLLQQALPPLIPYEEANLSPMEREFYANNRRVSNVKIKKELQVSLHYPTYKEGLTHLWDTYFAAKDEC